MVYIAADGTISEQRRRNLFQGLCDAFLGLKPQWKAVVFACLAFAFRRWLNPNPLANGKIPAAALNPDQHWKRISKDDTFVRSMTQHLGSNTNRRVQAAKMSKNYREADRIELALEESILAAQMAMLPKRVTGVMSIIYGGRAVPPRGQLLLPTFAEQTPPRIKTSPWAIKERASIMASNHSLTLSPVGISRANAMGATAVPSTGSALGRRMSSLAMDTHSASLLSLTDPSSGCSHSSVTTRCPSGWRKSTLTALRTLTSHWIAYWPS